MTNTTAIKFVILATLVIMAVTLGIVLIVISTSVINAPIVDVNAIIGAPEMI